jgi:hypothetical protein
MKPGYVPGSTPAQATAPELQLPEPALPDFPAAKALCACPGAPILEDYVTLAISY